MVEIKSTLNMINICITFIVVISCNACSMPVKEGFAPIAGEHLKTIWLVSHGWHAGIVLRTADIPENEWPISENFLGAEYLEVGWGDRDYYQTPNPHLGITLMAALLPTDSVLHIVGFNEQVTAYFPYSEIIKIDLPAANFKHLVRAIVNSFARNKTGDNIPLGSGLYGNSHFYLSQESYHLFNTCNVWTARALRAAGPPITPATVIRVESLMSRARRFGTLVQAEVESSQ